MLDKLAGDLQLSFFKRQVLFFSRNNNFGSDSSYESNERCDNFEKACMSSERFLKSCNLICRVFAKSSAICAVFKMR